MVFLQHFPFLFEIQDSIRNIHKSKITGKKNMAKKELVFFE